MTYKEEKEEEHQALLKGVKESKIMKFNSFTNSKFHLPN